MTTPNSQRDVKAKYLAMVVVVGEHSVTLSLHGRTEVFIAGEGAVSVVAAEQRRGAVVGKQRGASRQR
jgi:hypothetical protein